MQTIVSDEFDRETLEFDRKSFHYKVYKWWITKYPSDKNRRETLCHYWWIVVFLSPLNWFFTKKIKMGLHPYSALLFSFFLADFVFSPLYLEYDRAVLNMLIEGGWFLAGIGSFFLFYWVFYLCTISFSEGPAKDLDEFRKNYPSWDLCVVFSPIVVLATAFYLILFAFLLTLNIVLTFFLKAGQIKPEKARTRKTSYFDLARLRYKSWKAKNCPYITFK